MQDLITTSPSTQEIWIQARQDGSRSLFEDGIDKVKNGLTTIEELLRVAEPPKDLMNPGSRSVEKHIELETSLSKKTKRTSSRKK